jgi:outer membrane protein TolC
MTHRTFTMSLLLCMFALNPLFAQEQETQLSLEGSILKALKNNLGIQIEILNPETAAISVHQAQEKFIPDLSMGFSRREQNSASFSFLDARDAVSTTQSSNYDFSITQQLPTGGNLSAQVTGYKFDTNRNFQTINPRYGAELSFNLQQPLLQDFGVKMGRREILIAGNSLAATEEQFKKSVQDLIYQVEDTYWNLVYYIRDLEVKKQSLNQAEQLLEKNRRAVEVGTMAPMEVINAQTSVAQREADILAAETQVRNQEDRLKTLLNLQAESPQAKMIRLIPSDAPEYELTEISLEDALATAMDKRPDLNASRLSLKNTELDLTYAKNQMLPDLSLNAQYTSPGVSGDQLIYLNDNPLTGVVVNRIPGGFTDSLEDAFGFKYKNWTLGLNLNLPLNDVFSRAQLAQARVNLEQARMQIENQQQQLFQDIKIAVRNVESNYKRIQAYKTAREFAEKQLAAEEEKLKVGLSTNFLVLQYQTDLATARSSELRAVIDYKLSLAQLYRDIGTNLNAHDISMNQMYGK